MMFSWQCDQSWISTVAVSVVVVLLVLPIMWWIVTPVLEVKHVNISSSFVCYDNL